ncbi:MAG: DnaJ C-terminal domain-containing protein [Desulfomonilaceae bacterium]
MENIDPYKALGVEKNATDAEIKSAYRKLARRYHPDLNSNSKSAEARFKEISQAYEILGDKQRRQEYDMYASGQGGFSQRGFEQFFRDGSAFGAGRFQRNNFNASNFFGTKGPSPAEEWFSEMFGASHRMRSPNADNAKASRLEQDLEVTFLEAYKGTKKSVFTPYKTLEVYVPAGVDNGSRIRVSGQGRPSVRGGGRPGDLFLSLSVKDHRFFRREGKDIFLNVPVTLGEALLGARIEIPSPDGTVALRIPAGVQNATSFRFRGKGFPSLRDSVRGDFLVKVNVVLPEKIDGISRKLVEEFEKLNPLLPRINFLKR